MSLAVALVGCDVEHSDLRTKPNAIDGSSPCAVAIQLMSEAGVPVGDVALATGHAIAQQHLDEAGDDKAARIGALIGGVDTDSIDRERLVRSGLQLWRGPRAGCPLPAFEWALAGSSGDPSGGGIVLEMLFLTYMTNVVERELATRGMATDNRQVLTSLIPEVTDLSLHSHHMFTMLKAMAPGPEAAFKRILDIVEVRSDGTTVTLSEVVALAKLADVLGLPVEEAQRREEDALRRVSPAVERFLNSVGTDTSTYSVGTDTSTYSVGTDTSTLGSDAGP